MDAVICLVLSCSSSNYGFSHWCNSLSSGCLNSLVRLWNCHHIIHMAYEISLTKANTPGQMWESRLQPYWPTKKTKSWKWKKLENLYALKAYSCPEKKCSPQEGDHINLKHNHFFISYFKELTKISNKIVKYLMNRCILATILMMLTLMLRHRDPWKQINCLIWHDVWHAKQKKQKSNTSVQIVIKYKERKPLKSKFDPWH